MQIFENPATFRLVRKFDTNIFGFFKTIILEQDPFRDSMTISLDELFPNMVLAKPILTANGVKLLGAETEIRGDHIASVKKYFENRKPKLQINICRPK
jgi:hypothetical protein